LIVAYKKWGSEEAVKNEPIAELLRLYVDFHEKAETEPELEEEARAWFKSWKKAIRKPQNYGSGSGQSR
jgi:arginyl-tRNA synthetase